MFVFNHFLKFNVPVQLLDMNIEEIAALEKEISKLFVGNTKRKNYFLAVCRSLDKSVDLDKINREAPFGGLIGVGDSKLEKLLKWSKNFRLHATFHDAAGYLKTNLNISPGYCYVVPFFNSILNFCFLGQVLHIVVFENVTTIPINQIVNHYYLKTNKNQLLSNDRSSQSRIRFYF